MFHNFQNFSDIGAYHKNNNRTDSNPQIVPAFTFALHDRVHIKLHRQQMETIRRGVPVYRIIDRQGPGSPDKERYSLCREDYPHENSVWIDGDLLEGLSVSICGGPDHSHYPDDPPYQPPPEQDGNDSFREGVKAVKKAFER